MIREMLGIAEGILQDLHDDHNEVAALIERITEELRKSFAAFLIGPPAGNSPELSRTG